MRVLIARYAASHLSYMRLNEDFMELVRTIDEFAEDLVNAASNGSGIGAYEFRTL
jgi:hypothetical protein